MQRDTNIIERDVAQCYERLAQKNLRITEIQHELFQLNAQVQELQQELLQLNGELLLQLRGELHFQLQLTGQPHVVAAAAAVPPIPFLSSAPFPFARVDERADSPLSSVTDPLAMRREAATNDLGALEQQAEAQRRQDDLDDATKKTD